MAGETIRQEWQACKRCGGVVALRIKGKGRQPSLCQTCKLRRKEPRTYACVVCSKTFQSKTGNAKYCSDVCKRKYTKEHSKRYGPFMCRACQREFFTWRVKTETYCSRACSDKHGAKQRQIHHSCKVCKNTFVSSSSTHLTCPACNEAQIFHPEERLCNKCGCSFMTKNKKHIYCGNPCRNVWIALPEIFFCLDCGVESLRPKHGVNKRCQGCQRIYARALARNNPNTRAQNKLSKALRRGKIQGQGAEKFDPCEVFLRDGYRCQICKKKTRKDYPVTHSLYPNLDHVIPLATGGAHTRANTQCLCRRCNMAKSATIPHGTQLRLIG